MEIIPFLIAIFVLFILFLLTNDNVKHLLFQNNNVIVDDNIKNIKTSTDIFVNNLVKSKGMEEFKKYGKNVDIRTMYIECTQKLFNDIISQKNTLNAISRKLGPDDWVAMGYDNFVEKLDKLDPNSIETSTLNDIFNNMKITANINYDKFYNQNDVAFPSIIGPLNKKTNLEILNTLKKKILEYINNYKNDFISNFDSKTLIPKFDTFIDKYISSDQNYKDNFSTFSEEKLKPYIINEIHKKIINVYNKKLEEIKILLLTSGDINKLLCKDLGGVHIDNACTASEGDSTGCLYKTACTYDLKEDCINMFSDPPSDMFPDTPSDMFPDTSFNMFPDTSFNMFPDTPSDIFPAYKNNKCLTSAQSGLKKLVENNASNNDITYDSEYEKANITSEYCTKKGLEVTHDSDGNVDCKFTKNKPIIESVFGNNLINTINSKYDKNQYEICESNEIDGDNYGTIPDNLKTLLIPLTKKYGHIEKSLCIENNYGCPADKELVNGVCYNTCSDGYTKNPDKKDECYKLYTNFENNGELKNADIITRKIVNNPYLPQNICPVGYNYNTTEKKCIEKCPDGYIYNENGVCKKDYPAKWDGIKNVNDIKKNAISSSSKARISKCLTPNKPNLIDGLCYAECPAGYTRDPGKPYMCTPNTCPENEGYRLTDAKTCFRSSDTKSASYTKEPAIARLVCPPNYTNKAGVCWANSCPADYSKSTEGLCMKNCDPGYTNKAGVCWANSCPSGYSTSTEGMCMKNCDPGYTKTAGVCYKCPDGYPDDIGALCRKQCAPGYTNKLGTCWANSCPSGSYKTTEGMCMDNCTTGYTNIAGVCYKCPDGYPDDIGALCRKQCDPGYTNKSGTCWKDSCPSGSYKTTEGMCMDNCTTGYTNIAGVCYKCPDGYPDDIGALCRKQCAPGYTNKSGTCWKDSCPSGSYKTTEGMCMDNCTTGYTNIAGVCYKCPDGYPDDIGALCRKQCASGYTNISGTCWKDNGTYGVGVGTIPHKHGCDAGQRDDGTSCWEDWKCNTWDDGYYNYSWGIYGCWDGNNGHWWHGRSDCYRTWIVKLKTDCNGCGCIKKTLDNRQYCDGDKELKNGLCYTKCAAGYHKSTDNICQTDSTLSYVLDTKAKDSYVPKSNPLHSYVLDTKAKDSYVPKSNPLPSYVLDTKAKDSYVPKSNPLPSYVLDVKAKDSYVPDSKALPSYVPPTVPLPSTPATCPSDRDTIDGLCYPKCKADYWSSSATTCETNTCPQNYYKTKIATCQRDADTKINPNIGAGATASLICPEGVTEASPGGNCYSNNPPEGYQRHSVSLEQWTEKCPNDWTDTGWNCTRPTKIVKTVSAECPENYNIIGSERCKKDCEPGYEFKDEKCVQICPENTTNNTDKTCGREKIIINSEEFVLPYKYRIKKRKTDY